MVLPFCLGPRISQTLAFLYFSWLARGLGGDPSLARETRVDPLEETAACLAAKPLTLPQADDVVFHTEQQVGLNFVFEGHGGHALL
jgi:hypothetical protein